MGVDRAQLCSNARVTANRLYCVPVTQGWELKRAYTLPVRWACTRIYILYIAFHARD
jgi:hypothetical protein